MIERQPKAIWERALGWSYDLPHVDEVPVPCFDIKGIRPSPNHINSVYLELPRSSIILRGVIALISIPALMFQLGLMMWIYWDLLNDGWSHDWFTNVLGFVIPIVAFWAIVPFAKLDLVLPRDEPVRFNRLRRKVYFYQYRYHYIYLFSRKHWGVKPVAYNWDDVTAEVHRIYAPGHGGLIENVKLSIRDPETNKVIDRVEFTSSLYRGEAYWAIARLFMQQGPEALPKFVHPPRDWNDDDGLSHMHCLAPKVHWPEAIDRESRTAPSEGEAQ